MFENTKFRNWINIINPSSILLILVFLTTIYSVYSNKQATEEQLNLIRANNNKLNLLSEKIDSISAKMNSIPTLRLYGIKGYVVDEQFKPISYAELIIDGNNVETDVNGEYVYLSPMLTDQVEIIVQKDGYETTHEGIKLLINQMNGIKHILKKQKLALD